MEGRRKSQKKKKEVPYIRAHTLTAELIDKTTPSGLTSETLPEAAHQYKATIRNSIQDCLMV